MNLDGITPKARHPVPRARINWKEFVGKWKTTEDFDVATASERNSVITAAKRYGAKVRTRKLEKGGYRIWRVK